MMNAINTLRNILMNTMNFDISLCLGLGLHEQKQKKNPFSKSKTHQYSLMLGIGSLDNDQVATTTKIESDENIYFHQHASDSSSMQVSSFSNSSNSIKRVRDDQVHKLAPFVGFDVDKNYGHFSKKKLRLTKQQSSVLEDTFKDHSTLNPKKKLELANKLNLRTRQVEVWFQNRRARTKLKQTGMDREILKKCYETLTKENKRLEEELKELKLMKTIAEPSNYMQLSVCPSCKTICTSNSNDNGTSHTMAQYHLYPKTKNYMLTQPFAAIAS